MKGKVKWIRFGKLMRAAAVFSFVLLAAKLYAADTTPPSINLVNPNNGSLIDSKITLPISGTATDNVGMATVRVKLDDAPARIVARAEPGQRKLDFYSWGTSPEVYTTCFSTRPLPRN